MLCHWAQTVKFNYSWDNFKNDISIFLKIKSSAVGNMKNSLELIIRQLLLIKLTTKLKKCAQLEVVSLQWDALSQNTLAKDTSSMSSLLYTYTKNDVCIYKKFKPKTLSIYVV